ncbi:T9SS type A sorting domain-containing protein [Flavobacterium pedocola]
MMKKLLLASLVLGSIQISQAQLLTSDNFNALTVGNIGTDLTGTTAGQGGFYTYVAAAGSNADFQIVNDGVAHANVLQITGSATAANSRFLWKNGLDVAWAARTAGNNILEVEYDFYTGGTTTSKNSQRIVVYNTDGSKALVGLSVAMDTKIISGVGYYNNGGTLGNYLFNLGASPVVLPSNTWVRVGMSFNMTTGALIWKGPGFDAGVTVTGAGAATDPAEMDYVAAAGTANAVASTGRFDNITVKATNTDTLLGSEDFNGVSGSKVAVYPNPASDFVTIATTSNVQINNVQVLDINGRTVKTQNFNGVAEGNINISDLNAGVYFMTIDTNEGATTKKIIKS